MIWDYFYIFAILSIVLSTTGAVIAFISQERSKISEWLTIGSCVALAVFIVLLWSSLQRPPLRTMGETRLWYSFFVTLAGVLTYRRWHFRWLLSFTTVLAAVFCIVNILKPELHDKSMMPALQSAWFIPHVTLYMFAYSILGCSFVMSVAGFFYKKRDFLSSIDNLVYIGTALLTFGMLSGAIWAKSAWGDYWSWDPKETWAAITWGGYILYIHLRLRRAASRNTLFSLLILCFIGLQMCWYGYQYLPSSQSSMHIYTQTK